MTQKTNNTKIDDFGKKIGGARKDYAAEAKALAEQFANAANPDALKGCRTLSALVRLPNLEALAKGGALSAAGARAVLTIWRSIERKPAARVWKAARWAETTAPKLARVAALLGGAAVTDEEAAGAEFRTLEAAGWPVEPFTFGAYTVRYAGFYWDGYQYSERCTKGTLRAIKGGYFVATETTPEAMAAKLRELVAKDAAARAAGPALSASKNRARLYYIHPAHNDNISIHTMPAGATSYEVRQYMQDHRAELVERLHALQQFPALRCEWNRPRVGTDWRHDRNIMPDDFAAAIPFRGVEFGNWVNQTERANLLNLAFDGFHDLAQLWGIAPASCALGGSLAFAFGSRGKAGAMAHYEPARVVINLTKKNGAGCMAHEWFHAVDNWTMTRQGLDGYASEASAMATSEAEQAGHALLQAIRKSEFFRRSQNLAAFKGDYWTKGRELAARGFEGVCAFLMHIAGVCSDFLVNCVSMDDFTAADVAHRNDFYPYPTEAEAAALAPYYFAFIRAAFGDGVRMSDEVRAQVAALSQVAEQDAQAAAARRQEDAEQIARQRAEVEAAARDHAAALAESERVKMETRTAEVAAECGATWSYVFPTAGHYFAVGGGRGFVFLVYRRGSVAYRLTRENARIKKPFRGARGLYIEYRKGVDLAEAIRQDLCNGFTGATLMFDIFRKSAATTWAVFCDRNGQALEEAQASAQKAEKKPAEGEKVAAVEPGKQSASEHTETAETGAPADGLALVEIAGGVAVTGDSRTTFRHRKEIKAHGAQWNREAKQWQATEPDAVASLRQWFGVDAPAADEATTDSTEGKAAPTPSETVAAPRGVRYGVFFFSDMDEDGQAPERVQVFDTRAAAFDKMRATRMGRGWLDPSKVQGLANGGDWWYIYYSFPAMAYYCLFVAEMMPDGTDHTAQEMDEFNLPLRLARAKRGRLADQLAGKLATLRPRDVFRMEHGGEAVTVETDPKHAGRYVVAWWRGDQKDEQHTDTIEHDAATSVAAFMVAQVPAEMAQEWTLRDFITRYRAPEISPITHPSGKVWQYARGCYGTDEWELHEVRAHAGWFELVVNVCERNGCGMSFPDRFPSQEAAEAALMRFRPGSHLLASPDDQAGQAASR